MNKRTKIFMLDVFVLIFLLFILTFTASVFFNSNSINKPINKSPAVLTIKIDSVNETEIDKINGLDKVYSCETEELIGIIKDIVKLRTSAYEDNNLQIPYNNTEFYQITLTIDGNLIYNESKNNFILNGKELKLGDVLLLRVPDYEFNATILKIN